ncbi:BlaI/MecI/CopY family transcriptional regulator [Acidipila sp. EB88]|uniref:BlaI/MecI/CopY family transcriptional regulator n=1 Tax=Acidipila sp. EB88 TaxID=2305226 RepID=UPI000F5F2DB9|nr:BlaI/MecI/CopY family transcriptional regulator [Acidipila sp. EB88]RRA47966.1 BlaI/MecI/CopY family transcriptional regulator [Acidipila sp. EB88]
MPPKPSSTLTDAELRLMKLLWRRGESSVSDLQSALPDEDKLAYTSVLTTVRILEAKGYVRHRKEGRAFLYTPVVQETNAGITALRQTLARFFNNSREQLLLSMLGDEEITPDELAELKRRIAEAE